MKQSRKSLGFWLAIVLLFTIFLIPLKMLYAQGSESSQNVDSTATESVPDSQESQSSTATPTESTEEVTTSQTDVLPVEPHLLTVHKYGSLTKLPLAGAEFALYGVEPGGNSSSNMPQMENGQPHLKGGIPFLTKFMDSIYNKVFAQETNSDIPAGNVELGRYYSDYYGNIFISLPPGTYYLKEVNPPMGYLLNDQVYTIEIVDQDVELSIPNDPNPDYFSKVTLTKIDAYTREPIPNVEFDLYAYFEEGGGSGSFIYPSQEDDLKLQGNNPWYASILNGFYQEADAQDPPVENAQYIGRYKTNDLGQITIDLPQNKKYFFKEVQPAPGYLPNDNPQFFELQDGPVELTVENFKEPNKLTIKKYDSGTKQLLSNAVFEIYAKINEGGGGGSYLDPKNNETTPTLKGNIPFMSRLIDSAYSVVSAQDLVPEIPEGYVLYQEVWTDSTGIVNVPLPPGTYYIKEIYPPFGYLPNEQIYQVEISDKDVEISIPNDPDPEMTKRVTINKVDSITKKPIPGAVFDLYVLYKETGGSGSFIYPTDNEEMKLQGNNPWFASVLNNFYRKVSAEELPEDGISYIGQFTTDELGQIILNLPKNDEITEYVLKEVQPAPGYLPNESLQYFSVGEDPLTVEIENSPDPQATTTETTTTTSEETTTTETTTSTPEETTTTESTTTTPEVTTTTETTTTTSEETITTETTTTTPEATTITETTTTTPEETTTTETTTTTSEVTTSTEITTTTSEETTTTETTTTSPEVTTTTETATTSEETTTETTTSTPEETTTTPEETTTTPEATTTTPEETTTETTTPEVTTSTETTTTPETVTTTEAPTVTTEASTTTETPTTSIDVSTTTSVETTTTEEETSIPGVVITTVDQPGASTTSSIGSESSQVNTDSTTTEKAGIVVTPKETSTESAKDKLPESGEKTTPWVILVGLFSAALGFTFYLKERKA